MGKKRDEYYVCETCSFTTSVSGVYNATHTLYSKIHLTKPYFNLIGHNFLYDTKPNTFSKSMTATYSFFLRNKYFSIAANNVKMWSVVE